MPRTVLSAPPYLLASPLAHIGRNEVQHTHTHTQPRTFHLVSPTPVYTTLAFVRVMLTSGYGLLTHCSTGGDSRHRSGMEWCSPGSYCVGGVQYSCAPGTFQNASASVFCPGCPAGLSQWLTSHIRAHISLYGWSSQCIARVSLYCLGHYGNASSETSEACSGPCEAGYFCLSGATTSKQFSCGGDNVFCPLGAGMPTNVGIGNYR
jgi:hypothetical protein